MFWLELVSKPWHKFGLLRLREVAAAFFLQMFACFPDFCMRFFLSFYLFGWWWLCGLLPRLKLCVWSLKSDFLKASYGQILFFLAAESLRKTLQKLVFFFSSWIACLAWRNDFYKLPLNPLKFHLMLLWPTKLRKLINWVPVIFAAMHYSSPTTFQSLAFES